MSVVPDLAVELVARWEGLARIGPDGLVYPYRDVVGIPTQGYGIVVPSMDVPPITQEEARSRLLEALDRRAAATLALTPTLIDGPPERLSGVLSWVYNLGLGNLKASRFHKRLLARDWAGAGVECRRWVFAGGVRRLGLILRREEEARLIERSA